MYKQQGYITFTERERGKTEGIYGRHQILAEFFVQTANVCEEIAKKGACRVEHETFQGIKKFLKNSMEKQIVNAICFFLLHYVFVNLMYKIKKVVYLDKLQFQEELKKINGIVVLSKFGSHGTEYWINR